MSYAEAPKVGLSSKWIWAGRVVSALPVLMLLMSGTMKLVGPPSLSGGFTHLGWPVDLALGLGILELACTLLYVVPRTAVLGAVLLTGYLGGAVATHVRVGDAYFGPIVLGILVWLGLVLRDARLRTLLPLRRDPDAGTGARRGILPIVLGVFMAFAAIVVALVIVVALQPGDFRVARSTTVAATPAQVYAQVQDFHKWDAWSPWLELDPAAKVTFEGPTAGTGAVFTWSGNDEVGAGRMTLTDGRPNEHVKIKLDFTRPFESTCKVGFTFQPQGDQTLVTWSMEGTHGFLSKVFCLFMNMDQMIGDRFDKGLNRLKAVTELSLGRFWLPQVPFIKLAMSTQRIDTPLSHSSNCAGCEITDEIPRFRGALAINRAQKSAKVQVYYPPLFFAGFGAEPPATSSIGNAYSLACFRASCFVTSASA